MSSAASDAIPGADALLDRLDPEQREVATSFGGPVAVIAGAGTGKTRAITHRIAYGVASGVYNPMSVLAVTFTTRAAGEMRGRLQQLGVRGVQARTFHSAALRQAQYFWPKAYGSDLPPVVDNRWGMVAEAASRLRVSTETAALRDLSGEIGWAKVSNVTPDRYVELATSEQRRLASFDAETVARVFAAYEEVKRERQRIDFEDILLCTAAMISDHERVAAQIRRTYRHLVVDEYQDVSPLQQTLLDLWRGESHDLCVVGDPAQTIHTFAGARASFLTGFAQRHPGTTVVRLVRLTATHSPQPGDRLGEILCDADLGILAAPPERYRAYAEGVRADYAHIDDASFVEGRIAVLQDLLARESLFHTDDARAHWDAPARANLTAEIESLTAALVS